MFTLNEDLQVEVEEVMGTKMWTIHNFFKNPDGIVEYLNTHQPDVFKPGPNNGGVNYLDARHTIRDDSVFAVQGLMFNLCGWIGYTPNALYSNMFAFKKNAFNDYKNNYYTPHNDTGYSGMVYLNKEKCPGTNFYEKLSNHDIKDKNIPWKNKKHYKVFRTIESEYNKMILFDARKIMHSMAIEDDMFSTKIRMNVIAFLQYYPPEIDVMIGRINPKTKSNIK